MNTTYTLAAILLTFALVGCDTTPKVVVPEQKVVEKISYVVRIPPAEMTTLPPQPASIDVNTATQATVSQWVLDTEDYANDLASRIVSIGKFLKNEQLKLEDVAKAKNQAGLQPMVPMVPMTPIVPAVPK